MLPIRRFNVMSCLHAAVRAGKAEPANRRFAHPLHHATSCNAERFPAFEHLPRSCPTLLVLTAALELPAWWTEIPNHHFANIGFIPHSRAYRSEARTTCSSTLCSAGPRAALHDSSAYERPSPQLGVVPVWSTAFVFLCCRGLGCTVTG